MPTPSPERNERFRQFRASRPSVSLQDVAAYLGREIRTIYMWSGGTVASIPLDTLRLLELAFPATLDDDDIDLIG